METGRELVDKRFVGLRAARARVVFDDRLTVGRSLGQPHGAGNHRPEHAVREIAPHFVDDVRREARAGIEHRHQHAGDVERRVQAALDSIDRRHQLTESLQRQELTLDRDDDRPRGRQRVDRQQPQRGWAVDQHDVIARQQPGQSLAQPGLASPGCDELDLGAGQHRRRGDQIEAGTIGRLGGLGQGKPVDEHIVDGASDGELVDAER